jgi:hypothetical protein
MNAAHVGILLGTRLSCLKLCNILIWISLAVQKPFITGRRKTAFIALRRALTGEIIAATSNSPLPIVILLAMTLKVIEGPGRLRL